MQDFTQSIQGCGKLKYKYITALTQKERTTSTGEKFPGASKYELLCVIFLSQIADSSGYIEQFTIKDLSSILQCSEREVYCLIAGLIKKEYITAQYYKNENWSGVKNIKLIGNDFSNIKKYTSADRYISSFYPILNFADKNAVAALGNLSLFALRLLLYLLCMHDKNRGIRVSFSTLMEMLQVHDKKLIYSYFTELENIFGKHFFICTQSGKKKFHMIWIKKNAYMLPDLLDEQLTYYKRRWSLLLKNMSILIDAGKTMMDYLNLIFKEIYVALKNGISIKQAESVIIQALQTNGYYLNQISLLRATLNLEQLYTS